MDIHTVRQQETVLQIARRTGVPWKKIWDHPDNRELKQQRDENPDILRPGDEVAIPEFEKKEETCASDQKHRFRAELPMRRIKLRILDEDGEPLENHTYKLEWPGEVREGDASEPIDELIPVTIKKATLKILDEDKIVQWEWPLSLDELDPVKDDDDDKVSGVQARLGNLGYEAGTVDGKLDDELRKAIEEFQDDNDMDRTGEPADIIEKLEELYGS